MEDGKNRSNLPDVVKMTPDEKRRQRVRSIAIGLVLGALVVIFFLATIIRLGENVADRVL